MSTIKINLQGINELDFPSGVTSATTSDGVTTINIATGGGTVTSVALTMPGEFSVAGSPITGSGTFAVTKANQSANTAFLGPVSGGAAQPTFRNIDGADLPGYGSFYLNTGAVANPAAWGIAPHASSSITKIVMYTQTSDAAIDLTFDIKKNGTSILTAPITITHGTATGTVSTSTALVSSPLTVAQNDIFTLVITSGSATWTGLINLE